MGSGEITRSLLPVTAQVTEAASADSVQILTSAPPPLLCPLKSAVARGSCGCDSGTLPLIRVSSLSQTYDDGDYEEYAEDELKKILKVAGKRAKGAGRGAPGRGRGRGRGAGALAVGGELALEGIAGDQLSQVRLPTVPPPIVSWLRALLASRFMCLAREA